MFVYTQATLNNAIAAMLDFPMLNKSYASIHDAISMYYGFTAFVGKFNCTFVLTRHRKPNAKEDTVSHATVYVEKRSTFIVVI